jgi:hypothetical protein
LKGRNVTVGYDRITVGMKDLGCSLFSLGKFMAPQPHQLSWCGTVLTLTAIFPFQYTTFILEALMFRIYSFASRSAVRRSPTTLRCLRTFHYTPIPREKADNLYSELLADLQNNHDHLVEKVPRKRSTRSKLSKSPSPNRNEKPEKPKDDTERVEQATSAPKPKRARGKGKNNLTAEQKRVGRAERKANKAIQSRKIPPALLENPWKDVNKYLSVGYGGTAGRLPLGDNKRIHVISEALCGKSVNLV